VRGGVNCTGRCGWWCAASSWPPGGRESIQKGWGVRGCGLGALGTRCRRQRLERASSALLATLAARCPGGERDEELKRAARGGRGPRVELGLVARRARLPAPLRGAGRWGGWTVGATAWLPTAMGHSRFAAQRDCVPALWIGKSSAECKRARWRVENGVAECEWRGRIVSMRAASGGPPGKRESRSNGSRCVHGPKGRAYEK